MMSLTAVIVIIGLVLLAHLPAYRTANQKNVLLLLADDAGFQMGAYLNKICQTPHLDKLAARGLIFNNAYTSVSSCSPSRSAILTGMPAHQNGMFGLHNQPHHFASTTNASLPNILRRHGVRSGLIGKKHVGPASAYRFDFERTEEDYSIMQVGRNITFMKLLAREFFQQHKATSNSTTPFFLMVSFHDPHRCGHTQPQYGAFCQYFGNGDMGMGYIPDWTPIYYQASNLINLPYYLPMSRATQEELAAQYTTMSRLDQGVGLILEELKAFGYADNTLIMYTSDNGIPFPNGRTNLYDSGAAVPFILYAPDFPKRRHQATSSLVTLLDIVPTVLDYMKIPKPSANELTGKSLIPLLEKEPSSYDTEAIYGAHNLHEITMYYLMRMIRTKRFKLIHNLNYKSAFPIDQDLYLSSTFQWILNQTESNELPVRWFKSLSEYYWRPEWELFDLRTDPNERINVYNNSEYKVNQDELTRRLLKWQSDTADPWLCSPHSVLENQGDFRDHAQCLSLYN